MRIKSLSILVLVALAGGCDPANPDDASPVDFESISDADLPLPHELIDPNAEAPEDEEEVDATPHAPVDSFTADDDPRSYNPDNVPQLISPGLTCLNNGQCPSGEVCKVTPYIGATVKKCVGSCSTWSDCEQGETCGADGFCEVLRKGDWNFCRNGGCERGHGDCDSTADCEGSLTCFQDNGSSWGYSSGRDVCDYPAGHGNYCSTSQPCGLGQGDCDEWSPLQCQLPGWCKSNVGPAYGFASWVDVCVLY